MNQKDINFIPASQFSSNEAYRYEVTLSKNQSLFFSRDVVETYRLNIGVFKFYLDPPNNIIGWNVVRSGKLDLLKRTKGQGIKKLNVSPTNGIGTMNIAVELKKMNIDVTRIITKKHSVNSYQPKGMLDDGTQIDYIELDEYNKKK